MLIFQDLVLKSASNWSFQVGGGVVLLFVLGIRLIVSHMKAMDVSLIRCDKK